MRILPTFAASSTRTSSTPRKDLPVPGGPSTSATSRVRQSTRACACAGSSLVLSG